MKQSKKMRMVKALILISILLALSGMVVTVSAERPIPPNQFYGTVTINGTDAPVGTVITAYIDGESRGSVVTTTAGKYGDDLNYLMVNGDESDDGKTIVFRINGVVADETDTYNIRSSPRIRDLWIGESPVGATPTPTQDSSSGGTSSPGGGGIGTLPESSPTVTPDGATSAPEEVVTPDSPEATETSTEAPTSTTADESQSGGLLTGYGLMLVIIVAIIGLLVVIYLGIRKRE